MKKLLLILSITLIIQGPSFAEITIRPNLGLGLGLGGQRDPKFGGVDMETAGGVQVKNEVMYFSAPGINMGASIGFGLTEYFGMDIGLSYIAGLSKEGGRDYNAAANRDIVQEVATSYIPIDVILKASMKKSGKITPYIGFGFTMALGAKSTYTESNALTGEEEEWERTMNMGFGFNAVIGADYAINEKISLGLGLFFRSLALTLDREIKTVHTINGFDVLPGDSVRNRETEFVDDDTGTINNPNFPRILLTDCINLDSLVINLSLAIKL